MSKVWDYKSNETDPLAEKVEKDPTIVMTNPEMAIHLISRIEFKDGDVVIEPCKGDGAFYNNLPDNVEKEWCEINEGKDYLDYEGEVDICLSNPPFVPRKLFWSFMQKSMEITKRKIYWLVNIGSLNVFTPKRLEEMKSKSWFIQSFHVVSDKRWFGRYVWIEIGKEDNSMFSWNQKTF
tara:strand:- start:46 stop:582 length:537 start_codon:yes stop_codon:yes gene_type:complete